MKKLLETQLNRVNGILNKILTEVNRNYFIGKKELLEELLNSEKNDFFKQFDIIVAKIEEFNISNSEQLEVLQVYPFLKNIIEELRELIKK